LHIKSPMGVVKKKQVLKKDVGFIYTYRVHNNNMIKGATFPDTTSEFMHGQRI
jgi:predicted transcriptional regulator